MIDFLKRLFGHTGSSSTAKERLRLVLMTDHLELAPDMVDAMKRDLVDVISRYVEVDREKIDVTFEQQDKTLAMLANIPILAVNRNGNAGQPAINGHPASVAPAAAAVQPALEPVAQTVPPAGPPPKRKRRRRKKSKPAAVPAPALLASGGVLSAAE